MKDINLFYEIANNPINYARKWKQEHNKKITGFFCSYTPEEIIYAADMLPFRILGYSTDYSLADGHIQSYACRFIRSALQDKLSGKLDFIDGVVFPHTCDSIQRLSDIMRINSAENFHIDVVFPVKLNTEIAKEYLESILKKFKKELETKLQIDISDKAIFSAGKKFNKIRANLKKIYEIRSKYPDIIKSSDLNAILKASMVMDRDELLIKLNDIIKNLEDTPLNSNYSKKRIVLSGGICNFPDIYKIIENYGAAVVWDDLCIGSRYFENIIEEKDDIIKSISQRYLDRIICPAKHKGLFARGEDLIKTIKHNNAQGVIFIFLKFCDPHSFDYPYLKDMLDKEGIPSMLFEIEDQNMYEGQFKTRCEAFIEIL